MAFTKEQLEKAKGAKWRQKSGSSHISGRASGGTTPSRWNAARVNSTALCRCAEATAVWLLSARTETFIPAISCPAITSSANGTSATSRPTGCKNICKTENKYSAVERVSVTDGYIYIHINGLMAYILPKPSFSSDGQYEEFLSFITSKCGNVEKY